MKKTYTKPETTAINVECCQPIATSGTGLRIEKSGKTDDIQHDDEGYYWAE